MFPLYLRSTQSQFSSRDGHTEFVPNLSDAARHYLAEIDAPDDALFFHALAIIHAPSYVFGNAGALRQDWPRIPLPAERNALLASAELGRTIASLLDPMQPAAGIATGFIRPELRTIAVVTRADGGQIDPHAGDLALTVNWGYRTPSRAVMPGGGRAIGRGYTEPERLAIAGAGNPLSLEFSDAGAPLGEETFDVYLNERAYWRNVPSLVWEYTLGGYPVLKKWLSYREEDVLGRSLRLEEAREFTSIARRIAALILLQPRLDANYREVSANTLDWVTAAEGARQGALW